MGWSMASIDGRRGFMAAPARASTMHHFQRIAGEHDWNLLDAVEAITDDHAREQIGQIELVPAQERLGGADAEAVMSAFTRFSIAGSRFSDGSHGVLYLQLQRDAAVAQAQRAATAFLAATRELPIKLDMNLYSVGLAGEVADLRQAEALHHANPAGRAAAEWRRLGQQLRAAGIAGALYSAGGDGESDCLAIFRAAALTECTCLARMEFNWNGKAIDAATLCGTAMEHRG